MTSLTQWAQHGRHTLANILQEVDICLRSCRQRSKSTDDVTDDPVFCSFSYCFIDFLTRLLLLTNKETFAELTRGGAALSSRPGGSRLLLGHSLVLVPHAVSHPLHPFSPWKPLLQAKTQLSITASSATVTD